LPLAPAIVILVGLAVTVAIGLFGVSNLATASDDHAAARAELLASTLAARLSRLPNKVWLETLQRAARKTAPSSTSTSITASLLPGTKPRRHYDLDIRKRHLTMILEQSSRLTKPPPRSAA